MKKRRVLAIRFAALALTVTFVLIISGCSQTAGSESPGINITDVIEKAAESSIDAEEVNMEASATYNDMFDYKIKDDDVGVTWDTKTSESISLMGDSIDYSGTGAVTGGSVITITRTGTYIISGTLVDGCVIVDAADDETVRIILNGAAISCGTGPAINVVNSNKTIITLAPGSVNTMKDGPGYVFENESDDEPDSAIFSKDDLTINGDGSLMVTGNYKNGITSKDDLVITGGNITVTSLDNALKGSDSIVVTGGDLNIVSGGDGMKATNDKETGEGFIVIEGGLIAIDSEGDGMHAATGICVKGGIIQIVSGGGAEKAGTRTNAFAGGFNRNTVSAVSTDDADDASCKGIKAESIVLIEGGILSIDSRDDSLHSNGTITINSGDLILSSGDDGMHADETVAINGGILEINRCYEGIEGKSIEINGGDINIVSSDDSINIADGAGDAMMPGRGFEGSGFSDGMSLSINGGYIVLDSTGDGLDINGSVIMTDGVLIVNGPVTNYEGAIDYDRGFTITGGFVVATGSLGMAQAPDESSSQNSVIVGFAAMQPAGTIIRIEDENGAGLLTFSPSKQFQSLAFSSPEIARGKTYTIFTGGTAAGSLYDGIYAEAAYEGGSEMVEFTVTGAVTGINTGISQMGGGMGGMRPGGFQPPARP
ncbi:MAG: carbohydrate-binding domain-containing protein [Clostridia bacterium]|nr:carbohydrate-binding domain-containing protein [Clostridia bacterium]